MENAIQKPFDRECGILLPIFSLPSSYGIGSFGKSAYKFIDFLFSAGQSYWQVLPLTPIGSGNSPYSGYSAFAGNTLFIDLEGLYEDKLLTKEELDSAAVQKNSKVNYKKLLINRNDILRKAYKRFIPKEDYFDFKGANSFWLDDYCLYCALKKDNAGAPWYEWGESVKRRNKSILKPVLYRLKDEIDFNCFCQFVFYKQWYKLKAYANKHNVSIIGDIPIYVSMDSSDVWANTDIFSLDDSLCPKAVAGVPPDLFSKDGQLWGNPLYNWDVMEKTDFKWWKQRIGLAAKMYDAVRIDHFIGTVNYYSIPYGDKTAKNGKWIKAPADKLLNAVISVMGDKKIIAEDLGILNDDVINTMKKFNFPGMKIIEFAFDTDENNMYLPKQYPENCFAYAGTHDNETLKGFCEGSSPEIIKNIKSFLKLEKSKNLPKDIIKILMESKANTVILQLQDWLGLDNSARINTPSTVTDDNWSWMCNEKYITPELAKKIRKITEDTQRLPK